MDKRVLAARKQGGEKKKKPNSRVKRTRIGGLTPKIGGLRDPKKRLTDPKKKTRRGTMGRKPPSKHTD